MAPVIDLSVVLEVLAPLWIELTMFGCAAGMYVVFSGTSIILQLPSPCCTKGLKIENASPPRLISEAVRQGSARKTFPQLSGAHVRAALAQVGSQLLALAAKTKEAIVALFNGLAAMLLRAPAATTELGQRASSVVATAQVKVFFESVLQWYSFKQWALLVTQCGVLVASVVIVYGTAFLGFTESAPAPETAEKPKRVMSELIPYCEAFPAVYHIGIVFVAGGLMNCRSIFSIPLL